MILQPSHILVPDLCPIFFGEGLEVVLYPEQEDYLPKIISETKAIAFLSQEIKDADDLKLKIYDCNDNLIETIDATIKTLSGSYYYTIVDIDIQSINEIGQDEVVYFTFESESLEMILAHSSYYLCNPIYQNDIKKISYFNSENDWNMIFIENDLTEHLFTFDIECGFIPKDTRIESVTEDYQDQLLVNNLMYGDEYTVYPLTIGDSNGIPVWQRDLIARASLCETFLIDEKQYVRAEGAKIEKVEDFNDSLATYKIDLQEKTNYIQSFNEFYGIFDSPYDENFE